MTSFVLLDGRPTHMTDRAVRRPLIYGRLRDVGGGARASAGLSHARRRSRLLMMNVTGVTTKAATVTTAVHTPFRRFLPNRCRGTPHCDDPPRRPRQPFSSPS